MKTFLLTSAKFTGEIELRYNDDNLLLSYELRATLSEEQKRYFLTYMPRSINDLQVIFGGSQTVKITEIKADPVTFEQFWNRYDDKLNSSKKKAETRWDRMKVADREKAYRHIGFYFANIPHGTRKKYAETYLNSEIWNN